jgi:hypothetical protein
MSLRPPARPSPRMVIALLALVALIAGAAVGRAGQKEVTCGDTFVGRGNLMGDCTGNLTVQKGTLKLNGFTITGTGVNAVTCLNRCKIIGPGRIIGGGSDRGIFGQDRVTLVDVEVSGHTSLGVRSECCGGMKLTRANIHDNGGTGIQSSKIKGRDSEIKNNGLHGIVSTYRGVRLKRCQIWNNGGSGLVTSTDTPEASRAKLVQTSILDNQEFGILAKQVTMIAVNVSGNSLDPDCGTTMPCADVASVGEPKLRGSDDHCDTSLMVPENLVGPIPFGPSWGVCDLD